MLIKIEEERLHTHAHTHPQHIISVWRTIESKT